MTDTEHKALEILPLETRMLVAGALTPFANTVERKLARAVLQLAIELSTERAWAIGTPVPCAACGRDTRNAPVHLLCAKIGVLGERDCLSGRAPGGAEGA